MLHNIKFHGHAIAVIVAGLMLQMPGFGPSPTHVGFVVDIVGLGQAVL
jgi:hypothetical protein